MRAGTVIPADAVGLRLRRLLVLAMEQQMWFFGCDAACADGNLLVRHGFRRHRAARQPGRSSSYELPWVPASSAGGAATSRAPAAASRILLHGWCAGLHYGEEGGFLYARSGNRLGWYAAPEPPAPGEYDDDPAVRRACHWLGRRPEPGFCRLAALFLGWVEEYEGWIERTCGASYRRRCHARAPEPWLPPAEARAWLGRYRRAIAPDALFAENSATRPTPLP